jgi:hypothetical protein
MQILMTGPLVSDHHEEYISVQAGQKPSVTIAGRSIQPSTIYSPCFESLNRWRSPAFNLTFED